ncbi:Bifunctional inhibitor/plant lipid transfer protein/seed storage helical domain [Melia azedarach]|uniref:Bifunctional inhibitor/plant lipid transfer protein/seed storage helical domain n=1 Tax=Melia azedarach TaxID=155640 RepID=A0ACC1XP14_MELAZ|nr:Bifunctional inhibitor/plant lipid transfer protein/seed storage helical domain [Melia azedarach]
MRKSSSTLVVVLVVVAFVGVKMGCAELSAAECKEERKIGLDECKPVLYGKLPTPACCQRVRASHVECVCPDVTPWVVALIDVNRAIRLIEGCGRRVPRHFKCGCKFSLFLSLPNSYLHTHIIRFVYLNTIISLIFDMN